MDFVQTRATRAERLDSRVASDAAKRRLHAAVRMLTDALIRMDQNHPSLAMDELKHARVAINEAEKHCAQFEELLRVK